MTGFDRERLEDFIHSGEKSPPPVFVGRRDVLDDIFRTAHLCWKKDSHRLPGNTRIIHGAPGAGKSAILNELEVRSLAADAESGAPRVLALSNVELETDLSAVLAAVAKAGTATPHRWTGLVEAMTGKVGSVGAFGFSIGLINRTSAEPAPVSLARLPREGWTAPVVIAVDEAQRMVLGPGTPLSLFLQKIHDASSGLPLTLVLAGLGDTPQRARDMGLTRVAKMHGIGRLAAAEVREVMLGFCGHFGIEIGGHEERLIALACSSEGWPRHLHCTQEALGRALLAPGCDGRLDRVGDWASLDEESHQLRVRYYRAQRSAMMKDCDLLVAAVMRDFEDGMSKSRITDLIAVRASIPEGEGSGWKLSPGLSPHDLMEEMVHQGVLQEREDDTFHIPIPSFRNFLIRTGGLDTD